MSRDMHLCLYQTGCTCKLLKIRICRGLKTRSAYVQFLQWSTEKGLNWSFKGVLHPWALFLRTLCIFSKKWSNFGQSILWIWSEMFQGTQKSQFYFSRDHCCEVTVKKCAKINIFHVLSHKSITTWVSEIPAWVQ